MLLLLLKRSSSPDMLVRVCRTIPGHIVAGELPVPELLQLLHGVHTRKQEIEQVLYACGKTCVFNG